MALTINRIELNKRENKPSLAVFIYLGNSNPVEVLDEATDKYVEQNEYYGFIDENMDNPWTRVIVKDIEGFPKNEISIENRTFNLYDLHSDSQVEVQYLEYVEGPDDRPNPIMDIALMKIAHGKGYNAYFDSDVSDLWSRLIIFGVNEMPQQNFTDQKL